MATATRQEEQPRMASEPPKPNAVCVERAPCDSIRPPEERVATGEAEGQHLQESDMTALQKHCAYFDRNGDGYISPLDTYRGCRAIGCNILMAAIAATVISLALAPATADGWWPTLSVNLKNAHRSKHGSDTGCYDETGRFVPAHFDALFDRYDLDRDGALSLSEFMHRARSQRDCFDFFGMTATFMEFGFTYYVTGERKLSKETLRGVYDGSLFQNLEAKCKERKAARRRKSE
jgi:peroxygenase